MTIVEITGGMLRAARSLTGLSQQELAECLRRVCACAVRLIARLPHLIAIATSSRAVAIVIVVCESCLPATMVDRCFALKFWENFYFCYRVATICAVFDVFSFQNRVRAPTGPLMGGRRPIDVSCLPPRRRRPAPPETSPHSPACTKDGRPGSRPRTEESSHRR